MHPASSPDGEQPGVARSFARGAPVIPCDTAGACGAHAMASPVQSGARRGGVVRRSRGPTVSAFGGPTRSSIAPWTSSAADRAVAMRTPVCRTTLLPPVPHSGTGKSVPILTTVQSTDSRGRVEVAWECVSLRLWLDAVIGSKRCPWRAADDRDSVAAACATRSRPSDAPGGPGARTPRQRSRFGRCGRHRVDCCHRC